MYTCMFNNIIQFMCISKSLLLARLYSTLGISDQHIHKHWCLQCTRTLNCMCGQWLHPPVLDAVWFVLQGAARETHAKEWAEQ